MATNSISHGGIAPRLITRPAESAPRPTAPFTAGSAGPVVSRSGAAADEGSLSDKATAPTPAEMNQMAAEMQEILNMASEEPLSVQFREDERADGFVIEIRNRDGNVVRQFPPEKVLNLRGRLDELSGMVIDEMT